MTENKFEDKDITEVEKQTILYCKSHFQRTDMVTDLTVFAAKQYDLDVERTDMSNVYNFMCRLYIKLKAKEYIKITEETFLWEMFKTGRFITPETIIRKIHSLIQGMISESLDLGSPDGTILPLRTNEPSNVDQRDPLPMNLTKDEMQQLLGLDFGEIRSERDLKILTGFLNRLGMKFQADSDDPSKSILSISKYANHKFHCDECMTVTENRIFCIKCSSESENVSGMIVYPNGNSSTAGAASVAALKMYREFRRLIITEPKRYRRTEELRDFKFDTAMLDDKDVTVENKPENKFYIPIDDPEMIEKFIEALAKEPFVWVFRSISVSVGVYVMTNGYVVRTKKGNSDSITLVSDPLSINIIIKQETGGAQ